MSGHRWTWLLATALAAGVGIVAVSSQSLWIDEAHSAIKAMIPSFERYLQTMMLNRGSDLQMPLYMLMLWAWEKVAGHSEFALRAMNIPLFVAAISITVSLLKQPASTRLFFALFACSSAFVWAYLDEARPYIFQFFAASLLMVASVNAANAQERPSGSTLALFGAGALVLCGSSLIGVIFTIFYSLAFFLAWRRTESVKSMLQRRDAWLVTIVCGIPLMLLTVYYLWTLIVGAKAASVGTTNATSFGFCLYELFGFNGFGPGRSQLRENPAQTAGVFLPFLGLYAMVLAIFIADGLASLMLSRHARRTDGLIASACVAAAVACLLLAGIVGEFRVVGRHLMPAMPVALLGLAILAQALWVRRTFLSRGIVACTLALMLTSAIVQRFAMRHAKDDYRAAAQVASEALENSQSVWWVADAAAAFVYHTPVALQRQYGHVWAMQAPAWESLKLRFPPDLIIVSRPDVFDPQGAMARYIQENNFVLAQTFPGITIFTRQK